MTHAARQAVEYAARQLGFSAVGVAPAHADQGHRLQDWLQAGYHADMTWLERHLPARCNPDLVLPGVRSVIMLTYEYPRADARRVAGAMARYAQGDDYHKLLAPKLADLDETLAFYGGKQRCFTDSGPVSERFFAARAGLGWLGRHGLLVRPRGGSYCFLASILTTLDLPTDSPMPTRCGSCHRCEQACPTGALHEGVCDARKCLAYWTIEAKTPPPPHIRAAQGNHLYGCDACQEACPWNSLPPTQRVDAHLLMPARVADTTAQQLTAMQDDELTTLFSSSPVRRIGAEHLRSNADALLNTEPPTTISPE